jgi:hypothetical protein
MAIVPSSSGALPAGDVQAQEDAYVAELRAFQSFRKSEMAELDRIRQEGSDSRVVDGEVVQPAQSTRLERGEARAERAAAAEAMTEAPDAQETGPVDESRPLVLPTPVDRLVELAGGVDLSEWTLASEKLLLEPRHASVRANTAAREEGGHTPPNAVDFGWHATRGADRNADAGGVCYSYVLTARTTQPPSSLSTTHII